MRVAATVTKIAELNPTLSANDWAQVSADVIGSKLVLTTFNAAGVNLINNLQAIKMEPGKSTSVPTATRPQNRYYVDILMPREVEMHQPLLAAAILKFKSLETIENPNYHKPLGSHRLLRFIFKTTTEPRDVFTPEDESVPIREVILPCGSMAQVIHKWTRLNAYPPPSMARSWQPRGKSYVAAMRSPKNSNRVQAGSPWQRKEATPRPGIVPQGPPPPASHNQSTAHPNTRLATPNHNAQAVPAADTPSPSPPPFKKGPSCTDIEIDSNPPTQSVKPIMQNDHQSDTNTNNGTEAEKNADEPSEWMQVSSPRTKKARKEKESPLQPTDTADNNRFQILSYIDLDNFDDDVEFNPIAVQTLDKTIRPFYKSAKAKKSKTTNLANTMKHQQQLRHPMHILKHTPPTRGQYLLVTTDEELRQGRKRLLNQLALLRDARMGRQSNQPRLKNMSDELFLEECQQLLIDRGSNEQIHADTPIATMLHFLRGQDPRHIQAIHRYAWMDMITRAVLPHLYEMEPRSKSWQGVTLSWLAEDTTGLRILKNSSLKQLAACPPMSLIWRKIAQTSPETGRILDALNNSTGEDQSEQA